MAGVVGLPGVKGSLGLPLWFSGKKKYPPAIQETQEMQV